MTNVPYCPAEECIEAECSPTEPCCATVCGFCPRADCLVEDAGTQTYGDGTSDELVWCGEHKNEMVKR